MIKIVGKLREIARCLIASDGLNGMSNVQARRFVNKLLKKHTQGYFNDENWRPIHKTFKELDNHSIDYSIEKTQYGKTPDGNPNSKTWEVEIEFTNNKSRNTKIYCRIVASGAGTVSDPLSRYDVVAYAN